MLVFVQVCRTIDKKLYDFKPSICFERINESNRFHNKEACVARIEDNKCLKTESEDHQKLTVRESEDCKLKLVKSCYSEVISLQKEWKPGATTISKELKGIGCLFTEERRKRTIVQLYNHYSTLHVCNSTRIQLHLYWLLEWIWDFSFFGQLPNQATYNWWMIKLLNDSFDVLEIINVSFTPLYKGVKTWRLNRDSQQLYKCQSSAEIVSHQSSLRIS